MSTNPPNPYDSPSTANSETGDLFAWYELRWQIFPAALSWIAGLPLMVGGIFFLIQLVYFVLYEIDSPLDAILAPIMMTGLLGGGFLQLWAGRRWIRGSWGPALALNVAGCLLLVGAAVIAWKAVGLVTM